MSMMVEERRSRIMMGRERGSMYMPPPPVAHGGVGVVVGGREMIYTPIGVFYRPLPAPSMVTSSSTASYYAPPQSSNASSSEGGAPPPPSANRGRMETTAPPSSGSNSSGESSSSTAPPPPKISSPTLPSNLQLANLNTYQGYDIGDAVLMLRAIYESSLPTRVKRTLAHVVVRTFLRGLLTHNKNTYLDLARQVYYISWAVNTLMSYMPTIEQLATKAEYHEGVTRSEVINYVETLVQDILSQIPEQYRPAVRKALMPIVSDILYYLRHTPTALWQSSALQKYQEYLEVMYDILRRFIQYS